MVRCLRPLVFAAGLIVLSGCGDDGESGVGFCFTCVGVDTAPPDDPPDLAESCVMADNSFECVCTTESGETKTLNLTPVGCEFEQP
ncbi:MAG: hypothetical protein AAGF92_10260 [Myxococcota bacterium]